ncbi:MAG: hypothetical protein DMG69_00050 [Acidobacteria bacterium]|nr:MAG: hypothetical protein DMG69_00050 [Acidobacteriota bacterium]
MFIPGSAAEEFVARILATPSEVEGMTRFSLYTLSTYKFTRPMFMLPKADLALNIWLFRRVPIADKSRYPEAVAAVRSLAERVLAASGKIYPPYAPYFTQPDW